MIKAIKKNILLYGFFFALFHIRIKGGYLAE